MVRINVFGTGEKAEEAAVDFMKSLAKMYLAGTATRDTIYGIRDAELAKLFPDYQPPVLRRP